MNNSALIHESLRNKKTMDQIVASPIEWAYLAGIIDGEGCVDAIESKPRTRYNVSPCFRIRLCVTNTSERLIVWIHDHFSGQINLHHWPGQYKSTKNCWRVIWTGGTAEKILRGCLPYMIVKKHQAELAFKLRAMVGEYSPKNRRIAGRAAKLSDEVLSERRAVITALKAAKKIQ